MNIFHTSTCPYESARAVCDVHANKMLTETVQMLCTSHQLNGTADSRTWQAGYVNHPMTKWVAETQGNYLWALQHAHALKDEYYLRYGVKPHKSITMLENLPETNLRLPMSIPPQCMPDEYKNDDHTVGYRNYYIGEKLPKDWCGWVKGRGMPDWASEALVQ